MSQMTRLYQHFLWPFRCLLRVKRSISAFLFCLPTSLLALLLLIVVAYSSFSVFSICLPLPANFPPEPASFSSEKSLSGEKTVTKLSSSIMYVVKEESPPVILQTQFPLPKKRNFSMPPADSYVQVPRPKRSTPHDKRVSKLLEILADKSRQFSVKAKDFFENSKCKSRFFMTWISSVESLGDREHLAIESVFKSHPNGCLLIVSSSLDSKSGREVLRPFLDKGFKVTALKPDFDYIFKDTYAERWFNRLKKGDVDPGEVSLAQNFSNLLRLALLYKYGGIYIDTDIIILRSFNKLRNVIGAQTMDLETGKWSRLNNAVLIFDKHHPLVNKFIQEFALTFDGNKWGHNGPYLVSRVVSRVTGRPGFNFTVLPPWAFYPVDWIRIRSYFRGPKNEVHSKWLHNKLRHTRAQSFAVHLWNRQSRKLRVQEGSIIHHIMSDCCIFCNSSLQSVVST